MMGLLLAAGVIGSIGIIIGVLLGVASERSWSARSFRAITAADADSRAVTAWPTPSPQGLPL